MAPEDRIIRRVITEWKSSYSVGVEELDIQHQGLLKLINELDQLAEQRQEAVSKTKCFVALNSLVKYAEQHFVTEEGYLQKYESPQYAVQKAEHDKFVATVFSMNEKLEGTGPVTLFEIINYLRDWYTSHVLGMDREYKPLLAEKVTGADSSSTKR